MPDDIEPISEEELFKQQFLKQLSPEEAGSVQNPTADPTIAVSTMPKPLSAMASVGAVTGNATAIPAAAITSSPSTTPTPTDVKVVVDASDSTEEDTTEISEKDAEAKKAEDEAKAAELQKKLEEADLLEEAPDTDMIKVVFEEKPYVEWKGLLEVKEEREEIDDGRKDGKEGVEGEMEEVEDLDEFTVITDKEFQAQLLALQMPTLMKFFRPELLNRFDEVIFFSPLRKKELIQIVDVMLRETREMLGEKNLQLKLSDAARDLLADRGYNPAFGARPLRRAIQEYLEDPLSDMLIMGKFKSGDMIYADVDGKKLKFTKDVGTGKVEDMFEQLDESVAKNEESKGQTEEEIGVKDPFAEIYGDDLSGNPGEQKQPDAAGQGAAGAVPGQANPAAANGQNPNSQMQGASPDGTKNPFPELSGNQAVPDAMGNWPTDQTPGADANNPNSTSTSPFADAQTAENQVPAETMAGAAAGNPQEPKKHGLFGKMFAK